MHQPINQVRLRGFLTEPGPSQRACLCEALAEMWKRITPIEPSPARLVPDKWN